MLRFVRIAPLLICLIGGGLAGCAHLAPTTHSPVLEAHLELAEAYLNNDKPRLSLKELRKIGASGDHSKRYHFDLGLTYMALSQWPAAAKHLRQAVAIDPEFAQAWNNLGQVYVAQSRPDKAEQAFQTALDTLTYLSPERAALNLARLYQQTDRPQKAADLALRAIEENDRFEPAYLVLNEVLVSQGQIEEALTRLETAQAKLPKRPAILLALAENHLRVGNTAYARTWFQRIIAAAPQSEEAEVARDYLALF